LSKEDLIKELQYGIEMGENGYEDVVETSIWCPVLKVKINNNIYDAIIDTGSCETCILDTMCERLRRWCASVASKFTRRGSSGSLGHL